MLRTALKTPGNFCNKLAPCPWRHPSEHVLKILDVSIMLASIMLASSRLLAGTIPSTLCLQKPATVACQEACDPTQPT